MAPGAKRLGRVDERKGVGAKRFRIDLGRHWPGRFLYGFRSIPFASRELADAVLSYIEAQVARGRALEDVVSEVAPDAAAVSSIDALMKRWLESFRRKVETERRQPRTLAGYERLAGDGEGAHLAYWRGKVLGDIDVQSLEDWEYLLATKAKLSAKTRKNVLAAFHSFLSWVCDQRPTYSIPKFPWPETDEHQPMILSPELQAKVLAAIPEDERGIFLFMAETLVRPSEARVLRVRDWITDSNQVRVARAAKDQKTGSGSVVRGLKSRNAKVVPILSFDMYCWLQVRVPAERRLGDPDGPLFVNPDGRNGLWWSHWALDYAWKQACARVGVQGVKMYEGLKHSTATALKALGADDRLLAQLAGHRDPRSVEKYAKLQGQTIRNTILRLREKEK